MALKIPQWTELQRTRLLGVILLLGFVVAIPVPQGDLTSKQDVALLLVWAGTLCAAWTLWYKRDYLDLFWIVATIGAFLSFLFKNSLFALVGLITWRIWLLYRERRIARLGNLTAMIGVMVCGTSFAQLESPKATPAPTGDNPTYLKGYKLNDLTSCRQVDVVPWSLNEENRQARLLLRDSLRLSSESVHKYSDWSVYQTMDEEGSTTFIFKRTQKDGSHEYYLTKGSIFNRIVKRGKTKSVAEMKKLTNLIDSPALEFYHRDGSRLSFLPGSSGSSKLQVYLSPRNGARLLPPLYLEGRHCSRPEGAFDQDDEPGKQASGAAPMQSAPIAGGASSAGGTPKK